MKFLDRHSFKLPPWAVWSMEQWQAAGPECDAIRDCALGWDLTDFGSGDFAKVGLLLFTIRNGKWQSAKYPKPYAEKIMIVQTNQVTPIHFHWKKTEDIINRGGGRLKIQVWQATSDEKLSDRDFTVQRDGIACPVHSGQILTLEPGMSITMEPYMYHTFFAEDATALVGEVSTLNDDHGDNRFHVPAGRFPAIDEDAPMRYPLCTEYPAFTGKNAGARS